MENASKALIIAGAILLSILIIGLGMFIYTKASSVLGNTGIDEQEANAYNSKFTNYSGIITGSQARNLCDVVAQHNRAATDYSDFVAMALEDKATTEARTDNGITDAGTTATSFNSGDTGANKIKTSLLAGHTYEVNFGYSKESGHVIAIGLDDQAD